MSSLDPAPYRYFSKMNAVQSNSTPQGLVTAWDTITLALLSPDLDNTPSEEALSDDLDLLCRCGGGQYVEGWLLDTLHMNLTSAVVPDFWTGLKLPDGEKVQEKERARILLQAFRTLLTRLEPSLGGLERLGRWQDEGRAGLSGPGAQSLRERAFTAIRAILLFSPPDLLQERMLEFYSRTFSVHMNQAGQGTAGGEEEEEEAAMGAQGKVCQGCAVSPQECWCPEALEQLRELSHILSRLQLLERVSSDAVTSILHKLIEQRMEQRCRGEYEISFLSDFQGWLDQVLGWVSRVFVSEVDVRRTPGSAVVLGCSGERAAGQQNSAILQRWRHHMQQFFCRIYASMRIEELFSIIRDFPESLPAIEDLKFCLDRTSQRQQLLTSLKSAFETRLLHPGVHTSDIITVYISAIKALRHLDPSMVILQVACQPIRKYLRTREDTVRQIVGSLTGDAEGCTDLANELSRADPVTLETQDSEDEGSDPEEWTPDPIDALTDKTGSKHRSSDIISLLVSIYGSKQIFIDEYRTVLADRLLQQLNYSTAREIRNVELLKLRFGESHMHLCEVMLKDVADSRRINTNIREEEARLPPEEQPALALSAMILSSEFWPPLKDERMELPAVVTQAMETYTHRYEKLKAMRTLNWKSHLGTVTLDLELEDRTLSNLSVSPIHAAIILHFQDKASWNLEELSGALAVPQEVVRRKLALWQQHGVVREEAGGRYTVQETAPAASGREKHERSVLLLDSDEEGETNTATQSEQREEKLRLFWAYIQAMLTNLESMTLERIHTMLRMFVSSGPVVTEMEIGELQAFLDKKVRDHQLLSSAGVYRLPKSPHH
ncbi:anaphase-promoting complex subunit 2 [Sardina pilchardus]|uniref:anaphase-promoting complex subunit 2 n=1 Tax=Sardina pilchardus TaxID=27697 RepID=UPI002E0F9597